MYKLVMIHNKEKMYYYYEIVNEKNEMINNKSIQLIQKKDFKDLHDIFLFINIRGDLLLKSKFVEEKIKNIIRLYYNL